MMPPEFLRLGITGFPLQGSLSPRLHQAALQHCGINGAYQLYPIPAGDLALHELIGRVRTGELDGLNVTIPHKQTVIEFVDEVDIAAANIGAVNTIYRKASRVIGGNTDAPGFFSDVSAVCPAPGKALLLGAGGAARAVTYALVSAGWQLDLVARRVTQAQELARHIGIPNCRCFHSPASIPQEIRDQYFLLINATPLGMNPHPDTSPWPAGLPLPAKALVYDLVYKPVNTRLLMQADAQGLPTRHGLGMLVEQAALAFELWSGCRPPSAILQKAITDLWPAT